MPALVLLYISVLCWGSGLVRSAQGPHLRAGAGQPASYMSVPSSPLPGSVCRHLAGMCHGTEQRDTPPALDAAPELLEACACLWSLLCVCPGLFASRLGKAPPLTQQPRLRHSTSAVSSCAHYATTDTPRRHKAAHDTHVYVSTYATTTNTSPLIGRLAARAAARHATPSRPEARPLCSVPRPAVSLCLESYEKLAAGSFMHTWERSG